MLRSCEPIRDTLHKSVVTSFRMECAGRLSGRILDCGGGLGEYLPYLKGDVVVLDRALPVLQQLSTTRRVAADAQRLPFRDCSFDNVWACAVAQYVELRPFLFEATRVTRLGGHVLVLVPNGNSPWDKLKGFLGMSTWWAQEGIVRQYTVDDLKLYGRVEGEIRFLPFERFLRRMPSLGHTLMLDITVDNQGVFVDNSGSMNS